MAANSTTTSMGGSTERVLRLQPSKPGSRHMPGKPDGRCVSTISAPTSAGRVKPMSLSRTPIARRSWSDMWPSDLLATDSRTVPQPSQASRRTRFARSGRRMATQSTFRRRWSSLLSRTANSSYATTVGRARQLTRTPRTRTSGGRVKALAATGGVRIRVRHATARSLSGSRRARLHKSFRDVLDYAAGDLGRVLRRRTRNRRRAMVGRDAYGDDGPSYRASPLTIAFI
jgi:hypothetical protein